MTLSPIPRRSGRLLSTAVAVGLAVTAGPLAVPASAAAPAAPAAFAAPAASVGKLAPGSRIVSAGTTGYLSADPQGKVVWTRYADGSTTQLAQDKADHGFGTEHGTASDVVALGDDPVMGASEKITLRDMATGKSTFIDLTTYGYHYMGTVGSSVFAYKRVGKDEKDEEVHLLAAEGEKVTDRVVTGLPEGSKGFDLSAGGAGKAVIRSESAGGLHDYVVVDLATAKAVPHRRLTSGYTAGAAVSAKHFAVSGTMPMSDLRADLKTMDLDGDGRIWSRELYGRVTPEVGLVGDWAVFGEKQKADEGDYRGDISVRATPIEGIGGDGPKVLDHMSSLTPTPDGALLVMGGDVEQGEGLYRISAGADGKPVAKMVASTGEPTKVTLTDTRIPAVADLGKGSWYARWYLSRRNVEVALTLRHKASGAEHTFTLRPYQGSPAERGPGWVDFNWDGTFGDWWDRPAAPNGDYTWKFSAKPLNNLGPVLEKSGTFKVTRKPAPHDYTDNGTPDLLLRGTGSLSVMDTFRSSHDRQLKGAQSKEVGTGWDIYNQVTAVGDVAGASAGDIVARGKDGVLWLYLGKGDGTFADRAKIGAGWEMYDRITGGGDIDGDGRGDLLARDFAGVLWFYKGTGDWRAPFAPRVKAGTGWNMYNEITSVGDVAGGPGGDLVARDPDGVLWLYLGYGNGTFADRVKIGAGWDAYPRMVGIGDANADGKADLFVTTKDRTTYVYHGTGDWRAPFAPRETTGIELWSGDTIS
ncbi:VCBS repeat-containing protein [Streptomyces rimosus]|uniref:FG-GAP repeat domain-containing protein n=1 Tax=Streptomyces rimosus TaxID=1927 RepID=UPI0031DC8298